MPTQVRQATPELLAPAGGMETLRAALAAGADAIFCGVGSSFNARRGAGNFDLPTFSEACREAHLAGARVYVTVNIVIKESEMAEALALVRDAWLAGADAFIIQDWGLLSRVHAAWPQLEVHLSTQANAHDSRSAQLAQAAGASRVTLSRELSLTEIAAIARTGVELEVFGHGALCYCYSGLCLLSSMSGGRSGNRGLCAQPCRLPWELVDETGCDIRRTNWGRPLCPKDVSTIDLLPLLTEVGAASLKIEGRLKAPDYVWSVVSAYRAALDGLAGAPVELHDDAQRRLLARAFNRDFTTAYLHGASDNAMMSYERSNNRGQLVGEVVSSRSLPDVRVKRGGKDGGRPRTRKQTQAEVVIRLSEPVGEGDLLEIRPDADPSQFLTCFAREDAEAGTQISCVCARAMTPGDPVRVIRSQSAMKAAAATTGAEVPRKRAVDVRVVARLGKPFAVELTCCDDGTSARAEGFVVEAARTRAVGESDLAEHVGRMGNSPFVARDYQVDLDEGCGMSFSAVHQVRADAVAALEAAILRPWAERSIPSVDGNGPCISGVPDRTASVAALVASPKAAEAALVAGADLVYASADSLQEGVWPKDVIPLLDEVCREVDHERLDGWVRLGQRVAVGNVSHVALGRKTGATFELRPSIPVHNLSCLRFFEDLGASCVWLSPELSLEEIEELAPQTRCELGLVVSGRARVMTAEHCTLQVADRCVGDCGRCELRHERISLRNPEGDLLPVRTDLQGRSRIYAARPLDAVPEIPRLLAAGVCRFGVDATLLNVGEAEREVRRVVRALAYAKAGKKMPKRQPGSTSGHLHQPLA